MESNPKEEEAIDILQHLGLKEYESKILVSLTRVPEATAKEVSDLSGVPRTRVYDAIDVLESEGLVEVQHTSPKVFRAVSVSEATSTLQKRFESQTRKLDRALRGLPPVRDGGADSDHEVWSLSGESSIDARVGRLVESAESTVVVALASEPPVVDETVASIRSANGNGVEVEVGVEGDGSGFSSDVEGIASFEIGSSWVSRPVVDDSIRISRMVVVDGEVAVLSSFVSSDEARERAVVARGEQNSLVAMVRRLLADEARLRSF